MQPWSWANIFDSQPDEPDAEIKKPETHLSTCPSHGQMDRSFPIFNNTNDDKDDEDFAIWLISTVV